MHLLHAHRKTHIDAFTYSCLSNLDEKFKVMRGLRGGGCQRSLPPEITLKNRSRPPVPPLVKTISHNNLPRDFKSAHVQDQKK